MNSVSEDIATLLAANALGTIGTDLFFLAWGDGVDSQILILDVGGFSTEDKENSEQPIFQVLSRGKPGEDMKTAYATIRAVHEFLIAEPTQDIGVGNEYQQFTPISTIMGLGRDDNNRAVYSMNYYTFRASI